METETTFIGHRHGTAVFRCTCGTRGEISVPATERNRLVPCPGGCGAKYIWRCGRGFFARPTLEMAIEPTKRKAQMSAGVRSAAGSRTKRKDEQRTSNELDLFNFRWVA